jgi:uncharacterized membrane protein YfcA
MRRAIGCPYFQRAFGWSVPIGGLAGLIGLGGGEFRLPVLIHVVGFDAKSAVPLNLMVSLITLAFALFTRSGAVSPAAVVPYLPEVLGLALGGIASAFCGARLVHRLSTRRLVQVIAALLAAIGVLMLAEAIHPFAYAAPLPDGAGVRLLAGAAFGLAIGLVSSLLGVAGGELIIPTLVFVFGADIKPAGTASILISLGVVLTGLLRFRQIGALPQGRGVQRISLAMAAGSILGAGLGGLAVAYAPVEALKAVLGAVLLAAAAKTFTAPR